MNYLLDTCVLSEFTKRRPSPEVMDWVAAVEEERLFLSVLSLGEVKRGIERLPQSHRRNELDTWLNSCLLARFAGRLIGLDAEVMLLWGALAARLESEGKTMPIVDSLIAASALYNSLILVTRNEPDFIRAGTPLMNPWR
ncbi:MAG: type II toxin-antitoxin system VapC family toxin [Dehalococcoidia bacterium]|nr:type II toxin-antitoxin system VapC family toxin [Dehalococcoidia bacterium]